MKLQEIHCYWIEDHWYSRTGLDHQFWKFSANIFFCREISFFVGSRQTSCIDTHITSVSNFSRRTPKNTSWTYILKVKRRIQHLKEKKQNRIISCWQHFTYDEIRKNVNKTKVWKPNYLRVIYFYIEVCGFVSWPRPILTRIWEDSG